MKSTKNSQLTFHLDIAANVPVTVPVSMNVLPFPDDRSSVIHSISDQLNKKADQEKKRIFCNILHRVEHLQD